MPTDLDKYLFLVSVIDIISPKLHIENVAQYLNYEKYFIVGDTKSAHGILEFQVGRNYKCICELIEKYHNSNQILPQKYYISSPRSIPYIQSILSKHDHRPKIKGNFKEKRSKAIRLERKIYNEENPAIDDIDLLDCNFGYEKVIRGNLTKEINYNQTSLPFIQSALHGWPALFSLVYNLWHQARFNRNNFPVSIKPLHIYLYGESRIGKSRFFQICKDTHPRVMVPSKKSI